MNKFFNIWILFFLSAILFCGCNNSGSVDAPVVLQDSIQADEKKAAYPVWNDSTADTEKGIVGIYEVPEMLALCKLDSAYMKNVSAKIVENFTVLGNDLNELGAEVDKLQGIIYYNNNPGNFKFECFLLLDKMPEKKPRHTQIVVLESANMLIYNHYGPYANTFKAYEEIKKYCVNKGLVQTGQLREYYALAQSNERDPEKLLTRIMVPVVKHK